MYTQTIPQKLIILALFVFLTSGYTTPSACTSSKYFNYLTHKCQQCPTNTITSGVDNSYCNCTNTHYPNPVGVGFRWVDSCRPLSQTIGNGQVALIYGRDGLLQPTVTVITCGSNAYPNIAKTACIPCPFGMIYTNTTAINQCTCPSSSYPVNSFCVSDSRTNANTGLNNLLFGIGSAGCTSQNPSKEACQILLNKCAESGYANGNSFCGLLAEKIAVFGLQYTVSTIGKDNLGIFASSVQGTSTATVKNKLSFIVLQYNIYGQLQDIKPFGPQLIPCIATEQDAIHFQSFGLNLVKTCQVADLRANENTYYDVYVLNAEEKYVEVFSMHGGTAYYKRYYRSTLYNSVEMVYKSVPPLSIPYISLSTKQLPQITTSSKTDTINISPMVPFIIYNIGVLIIFIINFGKYMKYNPNDNNDPYFCFKVILIFFLIAIRHWGIALWIFLFGVSMYCFCFFKFQQTVYLLLPDMFTQWLGYYQPFMIVFYIQFGFVLLSICLLLYDMGSTIDYFMIDWEKEKNVSNYDLHIGKNKRQISVWRKLTIAELINIPFIVIFGIFFLQGLKWINLSYQIPNMNDVNTDYSTSSTRNIVLSYFLITFIFFTIAIVKFKVIRFLIKTWNPMPYQDFVDLCCISNISLIVFDHDLHGYYIHGMNPMGKAQGTLGYIQSIFEKQAKAFGKSRAFRNDDPDQTQTFQVCFPTQIRHAFQMKYKNRYLQKLVGRAYDTSIFSKPIPQRLDDNDYKQIQTIQNDMLQSFKYYLQGVKTAKFNVRQRTFLQNLVSCPIDKDQMGHLPIFFKDSWYDFTRILLLGHEILMLINTINFINIFYIATKNVVIACVIALIICRIVIKNIAEVVIKRNISKNTLIDDKFFS